jgi:hypothetical protein
MSHYNTILSKERKLYEKPGLGEGFYQITWAAGSVDFFLKRPVGKAKT